MDFNKIGEQIKAQNRYDELRRERSEVKSYVSGVAFLIDNRVVGKIEYLTYLDVEIDKSSKLVGQTEHAARQVQTDEIRKQREALGNNQ